MKKREPEHLSEFAEAMVAFTRWLAKDIESLGKEDLEEINTSILDDLCGMAPSDPTRRLRKSDQDRVRLGYAMIHLQNGFLRFKTIRLATKLYPWRGRIKRHEHLEMMTHLFLAEVYIYEQRLKEYLDACVHCARIWKIGIEAKTLRDLILQVYRAHFRYFISARNAHTHEADVRFRHISRISMIELLSTPNDDFRASILAPIALRDAKTKCLSDIDGVIRDLTHLTNIVLKRTKLVWSIL